MIRSFNHASSISNAHEVADPVLHDAAENPSCCITITFSSCGTADFCLVKEEMDILAVCLELGGQPGRACFSGREKEPSGPLQSAISGWLSNAAGSIFPSLSCRYACRPRPPYRLGDVAAGTLDEQGRAMSKSLGMA